MKCNLGYVDLGQIDLLVQEGFYSNRTDFIRTAIRNQLANHGDALKQTVARRSMVLGLQRYTRSDLERLRHGDRDKIVHPRNGADVIAQSEHHARKSGGQVSRERGQAPGGRTRTVHRDAAGRVQLEHWLVHGGGHAWFGGSQAGSYTDARGPDASAEMVRFFLTA